jgi:hypothetical protein
MAVEKPIRSDRVGLFFLKTDPQFDDLRSDPRFTQMMKKVGIQL